MEDKAKNPTLNSLVKRLRDKNLKAEDLGQIDQAIANALAEEKARALSRIISGQYEVVGKLIFDSLTHVAFPPISETLRFDLVLKEGRVKDLIRVGDASKVKRAPSLGLELQPNADGLFVFNQPDRPDIDPHVFRSMRAAGVFLAGLKRPAGRWAIKKHIEDKTPWRLVMEEKP